ncbi:MAG: alpha-glucosidase C-terminal domain-containing protein [Candidatus Sumerlaeia bacterium]|nr:alpha-glucosidase C-terminal domain-containing protein [Candidatus Sumerlaeia bacterium]
MKNTQISSLRHKGCFGILSLLAALALATQAFALDATDLSGPWKFQFDPDDHGLSQGWHLADHDDSDWELLEVPGDWGEGIEGVGWYRRTLELTPEMASHGRVALHFVSVDDEASVYIDGELVAENYIWDLPFHVDLSSYLVPHASRALSLAVRVYDHGGEGGILGPVTIRSLDDLGDLERTEWSERAARTPLEHVGSNVMYSVFVRNFTPEGTFEGLRKRLPELKGLGVDVLWLLPIHEIGEVERKGTVGSPYAIRDYYSINPDLGTEEDFRRLVDEVHARDMRIIIDLVLNHTSPDSVLVHERPELFLTDEDGNPRTNVAEWWDIVSLDWNNPDVADMCLEFMEYWVREFNIDGFRADVASMMPTPFWERARRSLEQIKPGRIFMLAESHEADLHVEAFDLTYAWDIYKSSIAVIQGDRPATSLRDAVLRQERMLPRGAATILFVENHDEERAINTYGGPSGAKLAAVLVTTLPGVPLLYTGTEVGSSEPRDIFEKIPVKFEEDIHGMRPHWTGLLALRAMHKPLQIGSIRFLDVEPARSALAYERAAHGKRVLVVLNFATEESEVTLDHDMMPTETLTLAPHGWAIFAE